MERGKWLREWLDEMNSKSDYFSISIQQNLSGHVSTFRPWFQDESKSLQNPKALLQMLPFIYANIKY